MTVERIKKIERVLLSIMQTQYGVYIDKAEFRKWCEDRNLREFYRVWAASGHDPRYRPCIGLRHNSGSKQGDDYKLTIQGEDTHSVVKIKEGEEHPTNVYLDTDDAIKYNRNISFKTNSYDNEGVAGGFVWCSWNDLEKASIERQESNYSVLYGLCIYGAIIAIVAYMLS